LFWDDLWHRALFSAFFCLIHKNVYRTILVKKNSYPKTRYIFKNERDNTVIESPRSTHQFDHPLFDFRFENTISLFTNRAKWPNNNESNRFSSVWPQFDENHFVTIEFITNSDFQYPYYAFRFTYRAHRVASARDFENTCG